ncbi:MULTISPECIES: helix-turn-helix transcriptional regulator [unclassified Streptomyces]|uniref:helix-turn-helix transcriptional regulator n=1 Tax=unclassified Streptomyces TaxID=2593676 RepID=UPI002E2D2024|nr:helix-turn-helix domain-containing protein [Streptomyces sp. NBC_00223]
MNAAQRGPRRSEVRDVLRAAPTPLGAAEVAQRLGVHPNTARFHLDALVAEGSVVRTPAEHSGPGRPRTQYAPKPGMDRGGTRSYRLLAQILLGRLAAAGPDAGEAAVAAGRAWGGYLVDRPEPYARLTPAQAASRLTALLDDLGFDPQPVRGAEAQEGAGNLTDGEAPEAIRLRHCPFLELAETHERLVCRIHLGLMQGALAELRAPLDATRLEPFAEPAACLAHLERAEAA